MNPVILAPPVKAPDSSRVRFKNILFATDLAAPSAPAQAYAVLLARMFGSHLFAFHVETGPGLSPRYEKTLTRAVRKSETPAIAGLAEFFHISKVPFTLLVEPGKLTEVLNRVVNERSIDLVILGTRGRKGLSHLLLGSMSENVSRSSTCPVIRVGPQTNAGFENSLKTILYATDFSDESRAALPYAISLAQEFNARLVVTHVAPERLVHDRVHVEGYLMNRLKDLAPQGRYRWCTLDHIVSFGDPAQQILKTAKEKNADLIVLGLHTSVQFTSHFPERLAYSIVCDAPCPVMSVLPTLREMKLARAPAAFLAMAASMN
jgi:nucleotide-binding universal stress UspA family protein